MSLTQFAIALGIVSVELIAIMVVAWAVQQRTGNSGWVDTIWTFGVGATGCFVALLPLEQHAYQWRQVAVAVLAACWCLRLGAHVMQRTRGIKDDPRYHQLAAGWGADAPRRMFWFLQSQAAVGIVFAMAIVLAAHNNDPVLRWQDIAGGAILMIAIIGEAVADRQLRAFKNDPANKNAICDAGLWSLSRHPNYFFEWLGWLAYPMVAIDLSGHNALGWLTLAAPACMYYILVHVSGIPPLEEHMLSTRGDAFRAYQQRTRAFLPLP